MIRQPSLDPDEPGSVLVDGGVTSGRPASPPTPPVSELDVLVEVVSVCWLEVVSDTSEDSVVAVDWVDCVDSETLPVSSVVVLDDSVDVQLDVVLVDVHSHPQHWPSCAATLVAGMSSAAPSSTTAPNQPKRRVITVRE